jgi:hypothetical protein
MLSDHGLNTPDIEKWIITSVKANTDYTTTCLRNLQARLDARGKDPVKGSFSKVSELPLAIQASMRDAVVQVLRESKLVESGESNQTTFHQFLTRRE